MSAAIAPNPNDPQAPLGTPARPWWIGYIRQLHLDIPLAVECGGTGKNTPLDASDIAETSALKIMTATERTKLAGIAENANNYTHPASHPQSMIEGLADALAGKAPLASPALTGTPTAPTAAVGTNTTQIATTAFVQNKFGAWDMVTGRKHFDDSGTGTEGVEITRYNIRTVRSSYAIIPASTAGTSIMSIGSSSNKYASLNLENAGVVSATTPAAGTNTTQLATTAFVQAKSAWALLTEGTPSGPTATGTKGMARFDADYFYVCTATNTWVRFAKDGSWT